MGTVRLLSFSIPTSLSLEVIELHSVSCVDYVYRRLAVDQLVVSMCKYTV